MNIHTKKKLRIIAEKFEPLIKLYVWPLAKLAGINVNMEKAILAPVVRCFSKQSRLSYIQYTKIPKDVKSLATRKSNKWCFSKIAIVLQGPILYDENFTENTILLYKKIWKHIVIIVSTWQGVKKKFKKFCIENNVYLIENEELESHGAGNINCQLTTSKAGVELAYKLRCEFTAKTRTDQRMSSDDWVEYAIALLTTFPSGPSTRGRIIFTSYGKSFIKRPFCLCDFFAMGYTHDLLRLYSVQFDLSRPSDYHKKLEDEEDEYSQVFKLRLESNPDLSPHQIFDDFDDKYSKYLCAEEYIAYNYCNSYCFKIINGMNLLEAYNLFLKEYAVVIDDSQLMLYWPKYGKYRTFRENEYEYDAKLNFKQWLKIYIN